MWKIPTTHPLPLGFPIVLPNVMEIAVISGSAWPPVTKKKTSYKQTLTLVQRSTKTSASLVANVWFFWAVSLLDRLFRPGERHHFFNVVSELSCLFLRSILSFQSIQRFLCFLGEAAVSELILKHDRNRSKKINTVILQVASCGLHLFLTFTTVTHLWACTAIVVGWLVCTFISKIWSVWAMVGLTNAPFSPVKQVTSRKKSQTLT